MTARRRADLRLVVLADVHCQSAHRMREDWRIGVSLEPSQPPWARGSGLTLSWDDFDDAARVAPAHR